MGQQQYIVQPSSMDEKQAEDENTVPAGASGTIGEAALAHAPGLDEEVVKEKGIPLQKAIQEVLVKKYIYILFSLFKFKRTNKQNNFFFTLVNFCFLFFKLSR